MLYVYGLDGELLAEVDAGTGQTQREYVWLDDQLVAYLVDGTVYHIHNDNLGTPQALTDETGATVWKASYSPFGKATVTTEQIKFNLRFPGQYYDAETGLHYNWHRNYDPALGRYLQSDRLGLFDGVDTYGYVHGNPLIRIDPTGEFAWGVVFAGADLAWQLYQNGGNFKCVNWVDVGLSALGGGLFSKAFRKLPGKEWSHWIPDRYIRKFSVSGKTINKHYKPNVDKYLGSFVKSRFNGNFVSKETHALTDSYRYKFMSRT
ncbi:RHS domain-containing protein [Vibrio mediterranei]|uniref:RHS repeat-associated core domain-containing protein n=1 Tax=Vibrio mediterranei TaxID=689 RepID=UPI0018179574|nr:RHS repeat-associated core domain-containing protein [Vibrio mediterranei]NUW71983.1 RHS domain-containing protein [Vibrio mediterranei]